MSVQAAMVTFCSNLLITTFFMMIILLLTIRFTLTTMMLTGKHRVGPGELSSSDLGVPPGFNSLPHRLWSEPRAKSPSSTIISTFIIGNTVKLSKFNSGPSSWWPCQPGQLVALLAGEQNNNLFHDARPHYTGWWTFLCKIFFMILNLIMMTLNVRMVIIIQI